MRPNLRGSFLGILKEMSICVRHTKKEKAYNICLNYAELAARIYVNFVCYQARVSQIYVRTHSVLLVYKKLSFIPRFPGPTLGNLFLLSK